jgi:hypothetical protein
VLPEILHGLYVASVPPVIRGMGTEERGREL